MVRKICVCGGCGVAYRVAVRWGPRQKNRTLRLYQAPVPHQDGSECMHSLEVGGVWGPAAKRFFNTCVKLAGDDRDIDLYHWSSERFSSAWINTIPVLLAMQYLDHESIVAGAYCAGY